MKKKEQEPKKLLLLEDDKILSDLLSSYLQMHKYSIDQYTNGTDAYNAIHQNEYNMGLLDICVPGINGLEILSMLRTNNIEIPIIIITGNTEDEEELKAYQNGSNIFHKKPIQTKLLLYQIRSILDREITSIYEYNYIKIDDDLKIVWYKENEVLLSPNEYSTLKLLVQKQEQITTKDDIIEKLYINDEEIQLSSVDTLISRLRRKLEDAGANRDIIKTARGFGYRLN